MAGDMFPRRMWVNMRTRNALSYMRSELRPAVHELQTIVDREWSCTPKDVELFRIASKLLLAALSLDQVPKTLGRFVVSRTRPYFMHSELLTEAEVSNLAARLDPKHSAALNDAVSCDRHMRELLDASEDGR